MEGYGLSRGYGSLAHAIAPSNGMSNSVGAFFWGSVLMDSNDEVAPEWEPTPTWNQRPLELSQARLGSLLSSQCTLPPIEDVLRWIDRGHEHSELPDAAAGRQEVEGRARRKQSQRTSASLPNIRPAPGLAFAVMTSGSKLDSKLSSTKLRQAGLSVQWRTKQKKGQREAQDSMVALARAHAIRAQVHQHLLVGRVPTPQWGARRELPIVPLLQLNVIRHEEVLPSYGWQPPGAAARLGDAYVYHEPGGRVRNNLETLKQWRIEASRHLHRRP